jgi:putative AlgH/UPF0301 family transcriptional regulator
MRTGFAARFALGCLIAAGTYSARAQDIDKPLILVASPQTTGFYSRAVLVVLPKGAEHVGFIINRATRTTLAMAFPDEPHSAKVDEPIYLGGPRGAQSLYAVVRSDPGEGSRGLFGGLFLTGNSSTLDRIIRETPHEARYFAGFAAWDAGELAHEIARGDWIAIEPDEALLFHPRPGVMWSALQQRTQANR